MFELYDAEAVLISNRQQEERGHDPSKLGGGSTPFVAVLDTHVHWSGHTRVLSRMQRSMTALRSCEEDTSCHVPRGKLC